MAPQMSSPAYLMKNATSTIASATNGPLMDANHQLTRQVTVASVWYQALAQSIPTTLAAAVLQASTASDAVVQSPHPQ